MFSRIVLGIDGSDHAAKAADVAAELAKAVGSEVLVLHVLERIAASKGGPATDLEIPHDAANLVEKTVARLKEENVNSQGKIVTAPSGRVVPEILGVAETFGADLIVVGSRGLSDFSGLLVGSVSHKLMQHASCPVLVVR
jgi:nucleotide-binding universal stress UspA family protein